MKKTIALLLCLVLAVGLLGCSPKEEESSSATLQIGFSRQDITPDGSVQLHGYPGLNSRWSQNVLDPITATCIAITDAQDNTILLYTMDLLYCEASVIMAKRAITKATGVDALNIIIATTHNHSAPWVESTDYWVPDYVDFMHEQMVAAAVEAMADRKPAEIYATSTTMKGMTFVRHYLMNDGTVAGANFGSFDSGIVKHMRDADEQLQLIRFKREGGKDVVMINWQTHPLRTGGATNSDISADLPGSMRTELESLLGCHAAYFSGAHGDLMPTSMITSEKLGVDYIEQGKLMAQQAMLAMDSMTKMDAGKVQVVRHDQEIRKNDNTSDFSIWAFSIGDIGFAVAPYEMFDNNGMYVKENSPFEMTFVLSNANSSGSYIAADWAYYEDVVSYEAGKANYEKGTAESLAESFVEILNGLYATRK